jgi:gamma-glutamylcyclotransferase
MSLYFAYGSNLDRAQMRRRCPGAVALGPAIMHGYRLVFAGYSRTWQGPVASIVPTYGARVEGVLYRLGRGELRVLDRYEGHPRSYRRYRRIVRDARGHRHRAQVYVLPSDVEQAQPSLSYLAVICRAYKRLGLDEALLRAALFGGLMV